MDEQNRLAERAESRRELHAAKESAREHQSRLQQERHGRRQQPARAAARGLDPEVIDTMTHYW